MLPARFARIAVEFDAEDIPDPSKDPLNPLLLSRLLADHHERWLKANGFGREARRIRKLKRQTAAVWLRVLHERKLAIQAARIDQAEPHPDLVRFEFRFRWAMLRLRVALALHFAGVRGVDRFAAVALRPIAAAIRPTGAVVPMAD